MKKSVKVLLLVLAVLLALTGVGLFAVTRLDARAKQEHAALSGAVEARMNWISGTRVALTENGAEIGSYTLEDLGLSQSAQAAATNGLSQIDLLPEAEFEALGIAERLSWHAGASEEALDAPLDLTQLDTAKPEADANAIERQAPLDAHVAFEDGRFTLEEAVSGNTLMPDAVRHTIELALTSIVNAGQQPETITAELTDVDCYEAPEVTTENTSFDIEQSFKDELHGFLLTVDFAKAAPQLSFDEPVQKLTQTQAEALVSLEKDGSVTVDEDGVRALVDAWADRYDSPYTKYLFDSEVDGYVPIQFLNVSYRVDREALTEQLVERLRTLDAGELTPEIVCLRNDEPFDIKDTYIEVDITNQKMTFYKDGELVVSTDIVTGLPDGHPTITGLYYTYYKTTDIWLDGPDYHVFVKYWVSITDLYGLHDASWRSKFGSDYYLYAGSHGCVNTPEEAMKTIYDNVTDGIPILSYHHEKPVPEEPETAGEIQAILE